MKTIQITIEDKLLEELDEHLNGQSRARSAFIRDTIARQLEREKYKEMERRDIELLTKNPMEDSDVEDSEDDDGSDWTELRGKTK